VVDTLLERTVQQPDGDIAVDGSASEFLIMPLPVGRIAP